MDLVNIMQEEESTTNIEPTHHDFIKQEPEEAENSKHTNIEIKINLGYDSEIKKNILDKILGTNNETLIFEPYYQIKMEPKLENAEDFEEEMHHKNYDDQQTMEKIDDSNRKSDDFTDYGKDKSGQRQNRLDVTLKPINMRKKTKTKRNTTIHNETHKCNSCFKYYSSEENLLKHISHNKRLPGMPLKCKKRRTIPNIYYYCDMCEKRYRYKQHIIRHLKVHRTCKICHRILSSPQELNTHLETHKIFKCSFCNICFFSLPMLREHVKSGHNEELFWCNICKKRFATRSSLARHRATIHNGIKTHICLICQKNFRTQAKLKLHESLHSTPKAFRCEV